MIIRLVYFNVKKETIHKLLSGADPAFLMGDGKSHNRTARESEGVGRDILILKKLFLELCGPRGNSFR